MPDPQPHILCVDDNDGARYALTRTLQRAGFRVSEAANGRDALAKVRDNPDLIVLDVQLPDISGYEVCQRIKADPGTATIPVLQISADFVDVEHRTRGLELGADAYLAHPIEPPELIATIRSLLRARRAEEQARVAANQLRSTFMSISDGICLLDAEGRVVRCNLAMEKLTGFHEGQLIGKQLEGMLSSAAPVSRMVQSRARESQTVQQAGRFLRVTCDPVLDDRGNVRGAVCIFSDITDRQKAQEEREHLLSREQAARANAQTALSALQASESRLRRMAEANMFGVMEFAYDGGILWANDEALALLGRSRAELAAGRVRWDEITPPEFIDGDARALEELRSRGVCTPFRKEYLRSDGTRVPVLIGATAISAERGICFALDLSVAQHLEQQLREKVSELESADQRKDEFLAMLAHELRNPLAAITTGMHLLEQTGARETDAVRTRAMLLRQIGVLTRLVDDLLDVSRITRGKVELRREPVVVKDAIAHALATSKPLLEERRQEVSVEVPNEPLAVDGDPTRLEQIIWNLVNNAAKYSEPGGRIAVTLRRAGNDAVLRVRDEGIGIAPEMLDRVFELFAQADQSSARSRGGLGVGLTLVRRLVEMHGGSVRARSEGLGKGSEFEVRLPLTDRAASTAQQGADAGTTHRRLLLVEDNPDIGETLRELLQLLGHRVELATDGLRGVQVAIASKPDAALVDIGLPGIDGYEVARRLRASDIGESIALVALTGYGRPEDRARALEAGFDAHLVKPVDPDELSRLLGEIRPRKR